jgi:tetratricopeptide (TPR) repeat protein
MQAVDNVVSATAAPDTRAPAAAEAAEPASTQESAEGKAEAVAQAEPESTEPTSDPATAAEPVERLSAEAWFERGENAREAGEPEAAVKAYRQALTQKPGMARAWLGLSRAHLLAGDMERAEFPALEAIRTGGSNVDFTLNYLEILQETGTARELLRELEKAKDRFPTSPAITLALASAYENIARNRRAAAYLYREFMTMAAPGSDYYQQAQEGLRRTGG